MSGRSTLVIVLALIFTIAFATEGNCYWWLEADEDDIMLIRIDNDPDAPDHEIDQGTYGYFSDTQQWITVLNFYDSPAIQPPFSWLSVYWMPLSK